MRMRFVLTFLLAGILASCANEDISIDQAQDYANLEVGNYWVYQWYKIDEDGNASDLGKRDSLTVISKQEIAGRERFIRTGNFF